MRAGNGFFVTGNDRSMEGSERGRYRALKETLSTNKYQKETLTILLHRWQ